MLKIPAIILNPLIPLVATACFWASCTDAAPDAMPVSVPVSVIGGAADVDWVDASQLSAAMRSTLPWFCDGRYIEPEREAAGGAKIEATANTGQHQVDNRTLLTGNVNITQADRTLQAPRVEIDETTDIAKITGPLLIREKGLLISGNSADTNLYTGAGTIDQATFLLHESSLRGNARQIERLDNEHLVIHDGKFTRCDPGSNVWSLASPHIELEPETGFGTARNVRFNLGNVPVAWFPYIRFPIDDKRHSGFLMPAVGYDSSGGTDIVVPYYFNLAPQYDASYELQSLWKRGLIHDGQFRFMTPGSMSEINAALLPNDDLYDDREIVDLTSSATDTSAIEVPPFEKQNRWLLNVRHNGAWTERLSSSINYSAVSDIDYLADIGGDVGSSRVDQFTGPIDQNINNQLSASLDRKADISYHHTNWQSSLLLQEYQSLDPGAPAQYELLPRLTYAYRRSAGPIDLDLGVEYSSFDRDNENLTGLNAIVGQRAVLEASVTWPVRNSWGYIIPGLGLTHRDYDLADTPTGIDQTPGASTPRFSLDSGLVFDRFFSLRGASWQQTLEPRLFYLYVEEDNQNDFPAFDANKLTPGFAQLFRHNRFNGKDRIGDANQLSVGLTSRLLATDTGSQLLVGSIGQIYYFQDREVLFKESVSNDPTRNSSPVFAEARLTLASNLNLSGRLEFDADQGRTNRSNFSLRYSPDDQRILNLSYVYTNAEVQAVGQFRNTEESDIGILWPIKGNWSAIARWNFGWNQNQTIDYFAGFEYNDCCWKSRLVVRRFIRQPRSVTVLVDDPNAPDGFVSQQQTIVPHDTAIFFEFQMKGLATLGERLDLLLEQTLPGYRQRENKIGQ